MTYRNTRLPHHFIPRPARSNFLGQRNSLLHTRKPQKSRWKRKAFAAITINVARYEIGSTIKRPVDRRRPRPAITLYESLVNRRNNTMGGIKIVLITAIS